MASIKYSLDGQDFRNLGVFVSGSDGIVNLPKIKPFRTVSWDNYHGEDVSFRGKYYEPREITLNCFIKASNQSEFINKLFAFERLFDPARLQRLQILVGDKVLVYEVYCRDEISVTKEWSDTQMVGTFRVKLIEPQPIKRVLKHTRTSSTNKTCTLSITTDKLVNIYWGDGTANEDVSGSNVAISHVYEANGDYYPIIAGCIDEIKAFTTNATVVWNKL